MAIEDYEYYGPTVLRVFVGLLFLVPGIMKVTNPDGIIGMLDGLGFPAAMVFGWILIVSEILFGLTLIVGFKVRWSVWPLLVILLVATVTVHLPSLADNMGNLPVVMFHVMGMGALVSLFLSGAGEKSIDEM